MSIRVSIIIPMYNAASTLREAVSSILEQQVDEMELLLVDDGSSDTTLAISRELMAQDTRIQVISQKNAGICAARNQGLRAARGEYVGFCDDDDVFLPGALSLLLQTAEAERADVVRGDYRLLREQADGTFCEQKHAAGSRCCMSTDGYEVFLQNCGPQFVWNALYRRDILQGIVFDERCRYGLEDFIFNMTVYARTDRVIYLPQQVYQHFESAQSTSLCQSAQALRGRIFALAPWMEAEYVAVDKRCAPKQKRKVWALRKAEAVTFLMHQLRDAAAPTPLRRYAWQTLRRVLRAYPHHPLDFWQGTGQNKKKTAALLLYQLRIQRLYDLISGKQSTQ